MALTKITKYIKRNLQCRFSKNRLSLFGLGEKVVQLDEKNIPK